MSDKRKDGSAIVGTGTVDYAAPGRHGLEEPTEEIPTIHGLVLLLDAMSRDDICAALEQCCHAFEVEIHDG